MTREEAKRRMEICRDFLANNYSDMGEPNFTAFNMAIQALSQEPCTDTVSIRKDILKCRVGKIVAYNVEWLREHWQMEMDIVCGVKPCDDAIRREDAEQMFRNIRSHLKPQDYKSAEEFNTRDLMLLNAEQMIHALPSVTQKSGKWIRWREEVQRGTHCTENIPHCKCSECDTEYDIFASRFINYCPNCGAKMESEDKE